jgi:hypothetical protein
MELSSLRCVYMLFDTRYIALFDPEPNSQAELTLTKAGREPALRRAAAAIRVSHHSLFLHI